MELVAIAVLIFLLRIIDVSIGTIRVLYTVQGRRLISGSLGVIESAVWIFAIAQVIQYVNNPVSIAGWSLGFGAGTMMGITLERWVASGSILMRVISPTKSAELRRALPQNDFGLTALSAEGHKGPVQVLFVVTRRRRGNELISLVQRLDPNAFVTIEPVTRAMGGFIPTVAPASSIRK